MNAENVLRRFAQNHRSGQASCAVPLMVDPCCPSKGWTVTLPVIVAVPTAEATHCAKPLLSIVAIVTSETATWLS